MLTVLLESEVRHQRRLGGMALSVVTHLAIIGAVTTTTVRGTPAPRERITPIPVMVSPQVPRHTEQRPAHAKVSSRGSAAVAQLPIPDMSIDRIPVPNWKEPPLLSSIDPRRAGIDDASIGTVGSTGAPGPRTLVDGEGTPDPNEWRGSELLMRIVTSSAPRYPLALRQAGIDGRVLVRFVVDTTGRIDLASVQVLQSTHELFTRAVRDALAGFRFRPAEMGRHRVPALAEMPFEFRITR